MFLFVCVFVNLFVCMCFLCMCSLQVERHKPNMTQELLSSVLKGVVWRNEFKLQGLRAKHSVTTKAKTKTTSTLTRQSRNVAYAFEISPNCYKTKTCRVYLAPHTRSPHY